MDKKILAIDLGTQSVKAALVTPQGKILKVTQVSHGIDAPYDHWAQQNPLEWWQEVQQVVKQLLFESRVNPKEIAVVSCCGQMHGPTGIDSKGKITTPMTQLWCDKRNQDIVDSVIANSDVQQLMQITANPPTTGWVGFKVKWEKENRPYNYKETKWYLVPKDFVNFKLTGVAVTDQSEASGTYLWDYSTHQYSNKMAEALGIDIKKFPPVHKSSEIIGYVNHIAAEQTDIPEGLPVIAGGGDFIVSLLGLGLVDSGIAIDMTGTSTLFVFQKKEPLILPNVQNLHHVLDGWVPFIMLDSGGLCMKWIKNIFDTASDTEITFDRLIELAESVPPGSEGLIFYPYLLGERNPDNSNAKGVFMNLSMNHTAAHLARAVMEGVVLALAWEIQKFRKIGIMFDKVILVGGATRNRLLNKLKANIWNVSVLVTEEPESSLQGAGLLGALGTGLITSISEIASINKGELIHPNPEWVASYKLVIEKFNKLYEHMLGYWK